MPAVVRGIHYVWGTVSTDHDGRPQREAPTREEVLKFAAGLAPDEAAALLLWSVSEEMVEGAVPGSGPAGT